MKKLLLLLCLVGLVTMLVTTTVACKPKVSQEELEAPEDDAMPEGPPPGEEEVPEGEEGEGGEG